ncbi:hypothetical protein [Caulobacter endophyticus]|uniref:hypothetical protein n=1 Tax=Caulobacter endophyticus TaxID=2172652 RepID=UPI0024101C49|nr:hypothetical protein [Caulobacter endophyticus]MDG2528843.1 hypothetical protein [Caulobacter endophyticus]
MLDFLWTLRGSIPLDPTISNEAVIDRVTALLERQQKRPTRPAPDITAFETAFLDRGGGNWQSMTLFDRGRFWVERGLEGRLLRYRMRSRVLQMLLAVFGVLMPVLAVLMINAERQGLMNVVMVFVWLYGVNMLLAYARIPWALRRAAKGR